MTAVSIPTVGRAHAAYDAGPRYTPYELAKLLRLPPPTREQAAVITAPVAPLLVVAGAGSGKTETMAARVIWLVANDYVQPDQVLGLTFTRKAAGELANRIRTRLGQLRRRLPEDSRRDGPRWVGEPTVTTYHAYAARVLTEHGVRAGYEPTARLLTEAARWQLADELVRTWDGDMSGVTFSPASITDAVLALAAELAEHLREPDEVARWTGRFIAALTAPPGRTYAPVREVISRAQQRLRLLPLVREFARRKQEREALDFADQLARAARLARDHPEVGQWERERFRVVLLDEYQDTSHAQVVLLQSLFGDGHPVTAVGDPCQAIYGWRGASAGTLDRFPTRFPDPDGRPAPVRQLTTSWRNRPEILAVANQLAEPLRAAGAQVATLAAARDPAARLGTATVRCTLGETFLDEASGWPNRSPPRGRRRAAEERRHHRGADPTAGPDSADRSGAAGARPAGGGGRPRGAAGHPGGAGRGVHLAGARRPDRRRGAGAAADRRPVADRPPRPGGAASAGPRAGAGPRHRHRSGPPGPTPPASRRPAWTGWTKRLCPRRWRTWGIRRPTPRPDTSGCGRTRPNWRSCGAGWINRCPI